jgi:hypothetical protein
VVIADGEFLRYLEPIVHVRTLMRTLLALVFLLPMAAAAQTGAEQRIVPVEGTIRVGIDRDALDSIYIDGGSRGCTTCRFDASELAAYDDGWNAFLNQLMSAMLEKDVSFSELIVRAYFGADGRIDYLLFHVGGSDDNTNRFIAAAEKVRATFRFTPAASGPFKQSATIRIGAPSFAE